MSAGATFTIKVNADTADAHTKLAGILGFLQGFGLTALGIQNLTGAFAKLKENLLSGIEQVDQLAKAAQRVGMPVQELSEMAMLMKQSGSGVEGLSTAMKGLAKAVASADDPTSKVAVDLRSLGMTVRDQNGALLSEQELLMQLADRFKEMPDGITKVRIATELLGRSGQQLIPFLNKGSEEIRRSMDESRQFGLTVGPEFAANAEHFSENMMRISGAFEGMWRKLSEALLPELNKLTDWTVSFIKDSGALMGIVGTLVDLYAMFAIAVADLCFAFDALGSFIGTFAGELSASRDPLKAWSVAADQFDKKLDALTQRVNKLAHLSDKVFQTPSASKSTSGEEDPADRVARLKAEMQELFRQNDLEMALSKNALSLAQNDNGLSPEQRLKQVNGELMVQLNLLKKRADIIAAGGATGALTRDEQNALIYGNDAKRIGIQKQLSNSPFGIGDNITLQLQTLVRSFGTVAQQIGTAFKDIIGGAIKTVSDGITGLIMGTKTWAQALAQIGTTILTSVVQAIVEMGVKWVVTHLIMGAATAAFHALATALGWQQVAQSNAQEAAKAPALATNAATASVGSFGAASIIGIAALVAAIGVGIAAATGAFQEGGFTGIGAPGQVAGIVHAGEYVFSAPAVNRIGLANLEAAHSGGSSPATSGGSRTANVTILSDERKFRDYQNDPNFEGTFVTLLAKHAWRFRR